MTDWLKKLEKIIANVSHDRHWIFFEHKEIEGRNGSIVFCDELYKQILPVIIAAHDANFLLKQHNSFFLDEALAALREKVEGIRG